MGFARESGADEKLSGLLGDLAGVIVGVADMLKGTGGGDAGTQNVYGENQLKADVAANDIFMRMLKRNAAVASIASEELEGEETGAGVAGKGGVAAGAGSSGNGAGKDAAGTDDAVFSVAFDPLDGSSLVDANLAVGSIIGVYRGKGFLGRKGGEQVAALIAVYGPRLTLIVTAGKTVAEFLYDGKTGLFCHAGEVKIADVGKIFAPGNLRACSLEKCYLEMLSYWAKHGYTLRYSGGMVPDVNQILKKGGGIFCYPGYREKPEGKLRLLYECAPIAMIVEKAGGVAVAGMGRVLDLKIEKLDQRTPIFLGSKKEVEKVLSFMQ